MPECQGTLCSKQAWAAGFFVRHDFVKIIKGYKSVIKKSLKSHLQEIGNKQKSEISTLILPLSRYYWNGSVYLFLQKFKPLKAQKFDVSVVSLQDPCNLLLLEYSEKRNRFKFCFAISSNLSQTLSDFRLSHWVQNGWLIFNATAGFTKNCPKWVNTSIHSL